LGFGLELGCGVGWLPEHANVFGQEFHAKTFSPDPDRVFFCGGSSKLSQVNL
jgi:hypothetical protein